MSDINVFNRLSELSKKLEAVTELLNVAAPVDDIVRAETPEVPNIKLAAFSIITYPADEETPTFNVLLESDVVILTKEAVVD